MSNTTKCPECNREYTIKYETYPMRDKDKFACECGHIMAEWNSTEAPIYTLIKNPAANG
jgi:hypothetical protein